MMTHTWSMPGRSSRQHRPDRQRGRPRGRLRALLLPTLVAAVLVVGGCSGSGDAGGHGDTVLAPGGTTDPSVRPLADEDVTIERPVITDDGRMLQPAGHVGLWFETEPEDPLDHLVWVSQRYVGDPVPVKQLGEDAWSPAGAHLPDVCAPEIVQRMVDMGLDSPFDKDIGPEYVQCAVAGPAEDLKLRDIVFMWGSSESVDVISQRGAVTAPDEWGYEFLTEGGLAESLSCIALRRSFSEEGAIISHPMDISGFQGCDSARKISQTVFNSMGGNLVQV